VNLSNGNNFALISILLNFHSKEKDRRKVNR
jgi:hypothetical protein